MTTFRQTKVIKVSLIVVLFRIIRVIRCLRRLISNTIALLRQEAGRAMKLNIANVALLSVLS